MHLNLQLEIISKEKNLDAQYLMQIYLLYLHQKLG